VRSLYTKYRPTKFSEFVGNGPVVSAIKKMVKEDKIPNVLLFHGLQGLGKTTLARMLPKLLKINPMDVKELDVGALRGIDNIRSLRESSIYAPMHGKYKVYILDEFHQATAEAKSAILKFAEDTPKHVIIIFCTTEPGKLPKTILSRCCTFEVKPLNPDEIKTVIQRVCDGEGVEISEKVISRIVAESDGYPRAALTQLESVIGLTTEQALAVIKSPEDNSQELKSLFQALLNKNTSWPIYAGIISGLKEEPETIRRAVLGYMSAILLKDSSGKREKLDRIAYILEVFENNWYDSGRASLLKCCYSIFIS